MSLPFEDQRCSAACQLSLAEALLTGVTKVSGEVDNCATAVIADARASAKTKKMRRLVRRAMDSLLKLRCVNEKPRLAFVGANWDSFSTVTGKECSGGGGLPGIDPVRQIAVQWSIEAREMCIRDRVNARVFGR